MLVEGLRAILALCISKDNVELLLNNMRYKTVLNNAREFLINMLRLSERQHSSFHSDYSKEKILEIIQASNPIRLQNKKCIIM